MKRWVGTQYGATASLHVWLLGGVLTHEYPSESDAVDGTIPDGVVEGVRPLSILPMGLR